MAKSRKRASGVPVLHDAGFPQYANDSARDADVPRNEEAATVAASDRERIAERAYELYIQRGGRDGRDLDDWLEAERQLVGAGSPRTTSKPGA